MQGRNQVIFDITEKKRNCGEENFTSSIPNFFFPKGRNVEFPDISILFVTFSRPKRSLQPLLPR